MLEDDPETPSPHDLGDFEVARQIADMRAVAGLPGPIGPDRLNALLAESDALHEAYARRFQVVLTKCE